MADQIDSSGPVRKPLHGRFVCRYRMVLRRLVASLRNTEMVSVSSRCFPHTLGLLQVPVQAHEPHVAHTQERVQFFESIEVFRNLQR